MERCGAVGFQRLQRAGQVVLAGEELCQQQAGGGAERRGVGGGFKVRARFGGVVQCAVCDSAVVVDLGVGGCAGGSLAEEGGGVVEAP